jgi:(p)ppGpp synthase/HD superfamily hydrolase
MVVKNIFAQTNLQLFSQMHELEYSEEDIQLIYSSYALAIQLMTGQYRASYKPFTAHLVGTASILAWLGAPAVLISAGLLHAIYESGDFGDSFPPGSHPTRRAAIEAILGSEVEGAVAQYYAYPWNVNSIRSSIQRAHALEQWETDVVTIRLSNELEDLLDYGLAYCGKSRRNQEIYRDSHFDLVVQLADTIGYPELARALESTFAATISIGFPRRLRGNNPLEQSFSTVPRSYKKLKDAIAQRLKSSSGPAGS